MATRSVCHGKSRGGSRVGRSPHRASLCSVRVGMMGAIYLVALVAMVFQAQAEIITGTIYCDNVFEFYFNGKFVASDPVGFTPHQAVQVSFEWDGVSDKVYAIKCQDYATSSGYEYINTANPQLGDGALLAQFSDGTKTSADWRVYVATHGPTVASEQAGCSKTNLGQCVVQDNGIPTNWTSPDFDDSAWSQATLYTAAAAGWGQQPEWNGQCCTMRSPLTRETLGCNVDPEGKAITVLESECVDPRSVFPTDSDNFLWGADLERDNMVLFRYTAKSTSASTPSPSS
eukprot:Sspe_Gene.15643::Locus_5447_Transcript_1_1_Confidence_1.000_Length_1492::g.15643::m.15643